MRLIDADAFDAKLFNDGFFSGLAACIGNTPRKRKFTIGEFRGMLKKVPTIDPESLVKHGKWLYKPNLYDESTYECSVCKEPWTLIEGNPAENNMHFCPNCGAKMDLEENKP